METEQEREVEQLKEREDVKRALKQTAGNKEKETPPVETKHKVALGSYFLLLLGLAGVYFLLGLSFFSAQLGFFDFGKYVLLVQRLVLVVIAVVVVLFVAKLIKVYLIGRLDAVPRFNLTRILNLLIGLIIIFIILSLLFVNWYTTVVSLGLLSIILGFALQTPITSFIGWIYILVKAPYRVGDRIRIGEAAGDVIDVSYLDTTLWEFGGEYLSTDHPSGRVIKFPNSKVLNSSVYNYSWPLFPYIWNEIKFQVAYDSDLEFVAKTMRETAEEEIGQEMHERINTYRKLLAQTPVDQFEVREHPAVFFRVNENTWIEAIVRYLVEPRQAGRVKTRLIPKMLQRLNAAPDRVGFPKSNMR